MQTLRWFQNKWPPAHWSLQVNVGLTVTHPSTDPSKILHPHCKISKIFISNFYLHPHWKVAIKFLISTSLRNCIDLSFSVLSYSSSRSCSIVGCPSFLRVFSISRRQKRHATHSDQWWWNGKNSEEVFTYGREFVDLMTSVFIHMYTGGFLVQFQQRCEKNMFSNECLSVYKKCVCLGSVIDQTNWTLFSQIHKTLFYCIG